MILHLNKKQINLKVKKLSEIGKIFGLMFRTKNTQNLLFKFEKPTRMAIHSIFVFHKFLAIWTDDKNKILEYQIIRPFTLYIKPKNKFYKLIEIPLNDKNIKTLKSSTGNTIFK